MSKPKQHHTVPRTYLEGFTDEDGRLTTFSKRTGKHLRPFPADCLTRYHYYSQPENGVVNANQGIETTFFGEIETKYPSLLKELLAGNGEADQFDMFETMGMMRSRSAAFREAFEIGLADLVEQFTSKLSKDRLPSPPKDYPDIYDNLVATIDPHRSLIAMAHYLRAYVQPLTSATYKLCKAPRGSEFLTSDNPVIWFERDRPLNSASVYGHQITPSTRVVFPLTKEFALIGRQTKLTEPQLRPSSIELSRKAVLEINRHLIACSWDVIIGTQKIPTAHMKVSSSVCPQLKILHFDSEQNSFVLDGTQLGKIRSKNKFQTS